MTDRYRNGDPANDRGGATGAARATGYDPADIGWFHGGDLKGLTGAAPTRARASRGSRSSASPRSGSRPSVGQKTVQGDSAAYHGYWGLDFTDVDPHLGTDADFAAFVDCAHRLGLKVYLDVVVNHTADVITPPAARPSWPGRGALPRLQAADVRRPAATRAARPSRASRAQLHAADADSCFRRHRSEEPGLAERRARATTTAGTSTSQLLRPPASSRATSSGSTTSSPSSPSSSRASREVFGGLDQALQDRRVPRRHGQARRPRVLQGLGAARSASLPRPPACGLRDLRRGRSLRTRSSCRRFVRDRGDSERARLPAPGRARALRRRLRRREGHRHATRGRRLLPRPGGVRADARDIPRQPRHRARRSMIKSRAARRRRAPAPRPPRAQPALPPPRRAGRLLRRRGRDDRRAAATRPRDRTCSRPRSPTWQTEERVGSPPIGTGSSFDVTAHPVASTCASSGRSVTRIPRSRRAGTRAPRAGGPARGQPDRSRRAA